MPGYYPVFLNLEGRRCVVIGGGEVAERKVSALRECGARVVVVSPVLTAKLGRLADEGAVEHRARGYERGDLAGAWLAIAATSDAAVNDAVAQEGAERGIFVNVVDDPPRCSFIAPAVLRRGDVVIAMSTGGSGPALARHMREELERVFPPEYAEMARIVAEARRKLRGEGRRVAPERWQECLSQDLLDLVRQGRLDEAREALLRNLVREGGQGHLVPVSGAPKGSAPSNPAGDTL